MLSFISSILLGAFCLSKCHPPLGMTEFAELQWPALLLPMMPSSFQTAWHSFSAILLRKATSALRYTTACVLSFLSFSPAFTRFCPTTAVTLAENFQCLKSLPFASKCTAVVSPQNQMEWHHDTWSAKDTGTSPVPLHWDFRDQGSQQSPSESQKAAIIFIRYSLISQFIFESRSIIRIGVGNSQHPCRPYPGYRHFGALITSLRIWLKSSKDKVSWQFPAEYPVKLLYF